jgi:hypothetical protein
MSDTPRPIKKGSLTTFPLPERDYEFLLKLLVRENSLYDSLGEKDKKLLEQREKGQGLSKERLAKTVAKFDKKVRTYLGDGTTPTVILNNSERRAVQRLLTATIQRVLIVEEEYSNRLRTEKEPKRRAKYEANLKTSPAYRDYLLGLWTYFEKG